MGDPYKLISERDPNKVVWACGLCDRTCTGEAHAKVCCVCNSCGAPSRAKHYTLCEACQAKKDQEIRNARYAREMQLIAKAQLVNLADYDVAMVSTTSYGEEDSYYGSYDSIEDSDGDERIWAWACTEMMLGVGTFDARGLVSDVTEEWFEDAPDHFDLDALQKVLDEWCASQDKVKCYMADEKRIVVLCADRRAEVETMVKEAAEFVAERDGRA